MSDTCTVLTSDAIKVHCKLYSKIVSAGHFLKYRLYKQTTCKFNKTKILIFGIKNVILLKLHFMRKIVSVKLSLIKKNHKRATSSIQVPTRDRSTCYVIEIFLFLESRLLDVDYTCLENLKMMFAR